MATRLEREHQWSLTPIHAQVHRPLHSHGEGLGANPTEPQWSTAQDAWLHDTLREVRRTRCAHRLNPPSPWAEQEVLAGSPAGRTSTIAKPPEVVASRAVGFTPGGAGGLFHVLA